MYRRKTYYQLDLFTVKVPIMDMLDKDNRIIKLAEALDWDSIDEACSKSFEGTS